MPQPREQKNPVYANLPGIGCCPEGGFSTALNVQEGRIELSLEFWSEKLKVFRFLILDHISS